MPTKGMLSFELIVTREFTLKKALSILCICQRRAHFCIG